MIESRFYRVLGKGYIYQGGSGRVGETLPMNVLLRYLMSDLDF